MEPSSTVHSGDHVAPIVVEPAINDTARQDAEHHPSTSVEGSRQPDVAMSSGSNGVAPPSDSRVRFVEPVASDSERVAEAKADDATHHAASTPAGDDAAAPSGASSVPQALPAVAAPPSSHGPSNNDSTARAEDAAAEHSGASSAPQASPAEVALPLSHGPSSHDPAVIASDTLSPAPDDALFDGIPPPIHVHVSGSDDDRAHPTVITSADHGAAAAAVPAAAYNNNSATDDDVKKWIITPPVTPSKAVLLAQAFDGSLSMPDDAAVPLQDATSAGDDDGGVTAAAAATDASAESAAGDEEGTAPTPSQPQPHGDPSQIPWPVQFFQAHVHTLEELFPTIAGPDTPDVTTVASMHGLLSAYGVSVGCVWNMGAEGMTGRGAQCRC